MNEFLLSHPEGCQRCQRCQAAQTVNAAFAAGLRPDPIVDDPAPGDLPPEVIEALVRDTLRQTLDALVPVLAYEITQQLR